MIIDINKLKNFQADKKFFIGIDSDGCVFDSMELKHKECFCPAFINNFDLQPAAKYARETWEFVNLYSKSRGCNRFIALIKAIDLLNSRTPVTDRIANIISLTELEQWVKIENKLGQAALEKYLINNHSETLTKVLNWSIDVTNAVEKIVHGVSPIPGVKECLQKMSQQADIMVVSQTPLKDLEREWQEHNIAEYARFIAGQEYGTKAEHLKYGAIGKYAADNILMIGDAPGDQQAAKDNGVLFYPVIAGREADSWKRFNEEALAKFFDGSFAGKYEQSLLQEFNNNLPEYPEWQN